MMNKSECKNYYEILEVPAQASFEEIKDGYNRVKNAYSGDNPALYTLLSKEECDDILDQIETAYSVLSVPEKRRQYDSAQRINPQNDSSISNTHMYAGTGQNDLTPSNYNEFNINRSEIEVSRISAQKRFQLQFVKNDELEQKIENTTNFTGEFLKEIREYKKVTIERLSDLTKISKTYIRYIEDEQIEFLPAKAYVRGFVYQYAKTLKLNPNLVATSYMNHIEKQKNAEVSA